MTDKMKTCTELSTSQKEVYQLFDDYYEDELDKFYGKLNSEICKVAGE